MKFFETPDVKVIKFAIEDVITTSNTPTEETGGDFGDDCIS